MREAEPATGTFLPAAHRHPAGARDFNGMSKLRLERPFGFLMTSWRNALDHAPVEDDLHGAHWFFAQHPALDAHAPRFAWFQFDRVTRQFALHLAEQHWSSGDKAAAGVEALKP